MASTIEERDLRASLNRLAQFGANITDAHSCFIFLPTDCLRHFSRREPSQGYLELAGYHSLSTEVVDGYKCPVDTGLIAWVAKHKRSIHVSPFEHDSRTLGVYRHDQSLKSYIGIPLELDFMGGDIVGEAQDRAKCGVVACDSKKAFAFSKLQGKLLDDLAKEVAEHIKLSIMANSATSGPDSSWKNFLFKASQLKDALGPQSVEILRVEFLNLPDLEAKLGLERMTDMHHQFFRLVQQALPPHFPSVTILSGQLLIAVDNMMTAYFENKLKALAAHLVIEKSNLQIRFSRCRLDKKNSLAITEPDAGNGVTGNKVVGISERGASYEFRRA